MDRDLVRVRRLCGGSPASKDLLRIPEEIHHPIDGIEHNHGRLSRDVPCGLREGRRVWTVVVYDWHHRDGGVHEEASDDRGQDDVRDGVVDGEEGYDEAC